MKSCVYNKFKVSKSRNGECIICTHTCPCIFCTGISLSPPFSLLNSFFLLFFFFFYFSFLFLLIFFYFFIFSFLQLFLSLFSLLSCNFCLELILFYHYISINRCTVPDFHCCTYVIESGYCHDSCIFCEYCFSYVHCID